MVSEVLRAYYERKKGGGADLYRLDAAGGVRIFSKTESITGETAVLDFKLAILKIDGKKVIYRTENESITANKQMEYWERQQMAIARGNAVAKQAGKTVRADILKALMSKNDKGKTRIKLVEAFNNVLVISDKDRVSADQAQYNALTGIAILENNVTITRGKNILTGDKAEIDLKTGISKLLTVNRLKSNSKKKKRIRGLIFPKKK